MRRVVITGAGAVTPVGYNFDESWKSVKLGVSGIREITRIEVADLECKAAGEIRSFNPELYLTAKEINFTDPFAGYAIGAAADAIESAGLRADKDRLSRAGIIVGSSRGGITTLESFFTKMVLHNGRSRPSPHIMHSTSISAAATHAALKFGIHGHCLGISNACSSGTNAIGESFRMIRAGLAEIIIAGGTEAPICRSCIEAYGASGVLSASGPEEASRPFDSGRDGFVLAEGACMLVLEELDSAIKRKAPIFGEIIGYGNVCDAFHSTRPTAEGEVRAIAAALKDAGISTFDVDYVNAHGTSTILGDRVEALAVNNLFGDIRVPISSIKSMTGHMLAASGAFETACTIMSVREGFIPATVNTRKIDSACPVNVITTPTTLSLETAITNSFGFGGANAVLVIKKYHD